MLITYRALGVRLVPDESKHLPFPTLLRYDYEQGRNLNVIRTQGGEEDGPLYDNERANGTTYYYNPAKAKSKYCNVRTDRTVSCSGFFFSGDD